MESDALALPRDARGEAIRIGEAVEFRGEEWLVESLRFFDGGCLVRMEKRDGSRVDFCEPSECSHVAQASLF